MKTKTTYTPARRDGVYGQPRRKARLYVDVQGPGKEAFDALQPRVYMDDDHVSPEEVAYALVAGAPGLSAAHDAVRREHRRVTRQGYARQVKVMRAAVRRAAWFGLGSKGATELAQKARFSWNAGCSTCRCSPGLVDQSGLALEDMHVDATMTEDEVLRAAGVR